MNDFEGEQEKSTLAHAIEYLKDMWNCVPNEESVQSNCTNVGANLQVVAGADDIYSLKMQVRPIASFFFAESQNETWHWMAGYSDIGRDLALVVIKKPFKENTYVSPIGYGNLGKRKLPPLKPSKVDQLNHLLDVKCSFYAKKRCCQLYYQTKSL